MWVVGGNFGSRINILNPVLIKYFRIFLDFWGFEDKVGYISFTRNYTGPQGIFASSVSNWRSTQQFLPDRDTRYASCQIWPFHVISVKVISVILATPWKIFSGHLLGSMLIIRWFLRVLWHFLPVYIWLQLVTYYYRQRLYGQTCKK